jgi:aspartate-semialdehyde dehydrogenase
MECRSNPVRLLHIRKRIDSGLVFRVLVRWNVGSHNLRKGAATNAVQIAEKLIEKGFLPKK